MSIPPPPGTPNLATSVDLTGMHMPANNDGPSLAAGSGNAAADEPNAPRSEMIRDHWSFRPRSETAASAQAMPGADPIRHHRRGRSRTCSAQDQGTCRRSEFVEPSRPVKPLRADVRPNPTTDAIEHSIGALKAAASTMRERPAFGDLMPKLTMPSATKPQTPEPAALPGLGELVIPATAERIAGSDAAASQSDDAPASHELPLPELPSIDLPSGPASAATPRAEAVVRAIESRAMDVFLAPIVTLSEHSVSHYEMTVALRSGDGARLDVHDD